MLTTTRVRTNFAGNNLEILMDYQWLDLLKLRYQLQSGNVCEICHLKNLIIVEISIINFLALSQSMMTTEISHQNKSILEL